MLLSCLSVARVRKKSNVTGTLDSGGKLSLVSGAVAGDSSGKNLRSVRDILMKFGCVLVIYALNLVDAESGPCGWVFCRFSHMP